MIKECFFTNANLSLDMLLLFALANNFWARIRPETFLKVQPEPGPTYNSALPLAYYQNVMHYSAYRGKSIECDV